MKQDIRVVLYNCSPIFYWATIATLFYLFSLQNVYSFFALPLMLFLHHGNHETVHRTLIPKTWKGWKRLNFFSGWLGFAILGHNYLQLRRSHYYHHLGGRLHKEVTLDMSDKNRGIAGKIDYYLGLLGWNAVRHEVQGYLSLILPSNSEPLQPWFKRFEWKNKLFVKCQFFALVVTLLLFYVGGVYFLMCRLLFLPMWGIGQNIAHYGLPVGKGKFPEFAARTYRVNPLINFLLYGAGFYHFEHHVMPSVPGLLLWHPSVEQTIKAKIGFVPPPKTGFNQYLKDAFRQFSGPYPPENLDWSIDKNAEKAMARSV